MPESEKIKRANETLKKELGWLMRKELDLPLGVLLTITDVKISSDLTSAEIVVSVFPQNRKDDVFPILNREIYHLQQCLNKRMRMRKVPQIKFVEDKVLSEGFEAEKILDKFSSEEKVAVGRERMVDGEKDIKSRGIRLKRTKKKGKSKKRGAKV